MSTPSIFDTETQQSTLIIVPLSSVGSLAGEDVNSELDDVFAELDRPDLKNVVFDFQKVPYFGSSMLGAMHTIWKRVCQRKGKMAVCRVSEVEREVLQISKFDMLWPIYGSREEALAAVTKPDE